MLMKDENRENKVEYLRIEDIIPNRFQPREIFDETGLSELADSIREHGVIQPILVRKIGDKYELIAGERRMKASSLAGLTTIPAIIRDMDDRESAKVSLLENLQRRNLSAIEEAKTYKRILELENMTQEELARTMGRSQPMVANKLRLLSLPEEVQDALMKNQISERHARSLLTIQDKKDQLMFLDRIRKERLTVRELDSEIKTYKKEKEKSKGIEENENKERYMNNNFGNFGGMGLNDYQSGVNSNMFNNIPNNFNNMANPVGSPNEPIANNFDYREFENTTNSFNNQTMPSTKNQEENFGTQGFISEPNSTSSLGSMFDGDMVQGFNPSMDNSAGSNLFVSQIREDNVPKKENQFLPNFDDIQPNLNNFSTNDNLNFESMPNSNTMDNNFYSQPSQNFMPQNPYPSSFNMGAGNRMNNSPSPMNEMPHNNSFPSMGMNSNFENSSYNMGMDNQSNRYPNGNLSMGMNLNPSKTPMENFNLYENPGHPTEQRTMQSEGNQPFIPSLNTDFSMNNFGNYNEYDRQNENPIPEYGNGNTYIQNPNNGGMFNQPLNIVGPYGQSEFETPTPSSDSSLETSLSREEETSREPENQVEEPNENKLFTKPVLMESDETNQDETSFVETSQEELSTNETQDPSVDLEVIGDKENHPTESAIERQEESKPEYIQLGEEITLHNTRDAVLELKKTTDRIKQNHIDIETEEIDFDDVYQITIKIKKEEN